MSADQQASAQMGKVVCHVVRLTLRSLEEETYECLSPTAVDHAISLHKGNTKSITYYTCFEDSLGARADQLGMEGKVGDTAYCYPCINGHQFWSLQILFPDDLQFAECRLCSF